MAQSVFVGWFGSIKMESSASGTIFPVTSIFRDGATDILTISSTAVTSTVPGLFPDAAGATAPSLAAKDNTDTGMSFAASTLRFSLDGTYYMAMFATEYQLRSDTSLGWSSGNIGSSSDVSLSRGAANRLDLATADSFNMVGGGASFQMATVPIISSTAPTVSSAGTSPSVAGTNTAAFRVNVGTGGTATTIVLTMPTATTGWNCFAENITATAANRANQRVQFVSSTTTSITVQNITISTGAALAFTASDTVAFICTAY